MYLHATDKVLKDDNLLALFDIPKILWPRLLSGSAVVTI